MTQGFDKLDGYLKRHPYFGTTTGRYANRIAKGAVHTGWEDYKLLTRSFTGIVPIWVRASPETGTSTD